MTKMNSEYLGDLRVKSFHSSGAEVLTDAPQDNQGKGEAFSPTDLLCSSLGSCMLTIMGIKAKSLGLDIKGVKLTIEKKMQAQPRKVAEIILKFQWPASLVGHPQLKELQVAAAECPVMLSLSSDIKKTIYW